MTEIDYTQLSTFITCPQKYYLKFVLGLKKIVLDERTIDLRFGQVVHKGLEYLYQGELSSRVVGVFDEFEDLEGEKHKTKANGRELLSQYIEHYKEQDTGMEVLGVEINDHIMIGDIKYLVKIDGIVRLRDNIYILEHKSTKKMSYNYFNQFSPNMQISGYSLYAQLKYGQCSGCIVNVLQSGWRDRAYRGEPAGFHSKFQREVVNRTKEQLEDFRKNVKLWTDKLDDSLATLKEGADWFGKNEGACSQYRGCSYSELCLTSQGIELDQEIEASMYERVDTKAYLKGGG